MCDKKLCFGEGDFMFRGDLKVKEPEIIGDGVIRTNEIEIRGERLKVEWPEVNEDELVGYIMRAVAEQEDYHNLTYNEVKSVLDAELAFLIGKGIVHEE